MGSGKTALVSLLPRLTTSPRGSVEIDGADVRSVDLASLRHAIAVVNDDPFLFSATVHDNIAYAHPDATREEVQRAAAAAQADGFIRELPDGYDTLVGERGLTALRRTAPADRDRARDPRRPADPDPRRRDLVGRRVDRAADQARAARGDGGPHDVRDRPPAVDDRARGRDRRAGARADRRSRARTTSCSSARTCTARSSRRACPTRCS